MGNGCNEARDKVYYYLDHEQLTWVQRTRIRYHLWRCTRCADCYGFEAHLQAVIRSRSQEDPPTELIDRLRAFLHEQGTDEPQA